MATNVFAPSKGQQVFGSQLPSYDALLSCIRCGRCLPVCPTYQETQLETFSPRGRLNLMRAVEDGKIGLTSGVEDRLYHCLDCRSCNTVCPPGLPIGQLILKGRVASAENRPRPWLMRFALQRLMVSPASLEVVSPLLRIAQKLKLDAVADALVRWLPVVGPRLHGFMQMAPHITAPLRKELPVVSQAIGEKQHRVAFFLGCIMNVAMADTSRATVRVLRRVGCEVVTPRGQSCCGAPHDDQSMQDLAREFARRNIALFEEQLDRVEAIVTDCAGCGGTLKEYGEWLRDDPAWANRAHRFSAKVRDITEYLDEIWPDELVPRLSVPVLGTYHDPCHLSNVQGVRRQPRRLLGRVQGLTLREIPDSTPTKCCGSAGIYNITHPPMAMALLDKKMAEVSATGAEMVITANPGCMLQLSLGAKRSAERLPVRHVVEVLDEALRGAE
jgi:glycolate oxidase iron-sulfur subunit